VMAMRDFDVVCFQEVFGGIYSEIREKLVAYALKAGFFYHVCDDQPQFSSSYVSDGGLIIFSRLPIVASRARPYSYS